MVPLAKSRVCLVLALALLFALPMLVQQTASRPTETAQALPTVGGITLLACTPAVFNVYNTNGTASSIVGGSITLYGNNKTDAYSDAVSYSSVYAGKSLVLQASAAAKINAFSNEGTDQFAVFVANDTTSYKGDEFGFVLPETGSTWYAYVQSPQMNGFYIWHSLLTLGSDGETKHDFKAVYFKNGSTSQVSFYVDGKLGWSTQYPNVASQSFHLALCSHKVSSQNIDTSNNTMTVEAASLIAETGATISNPEP